MLIVNYYIYFFRGLCVLVSVLAAACASFSVCPFAEGTFQFLNDFFAPEGLPAISIPEICDTRSSVSIDDNSTDAFSGRSSGLTHGIPMNLSNFFLEDIIFDG